MARGVPRYPGAMEDRVVKFDVPGKPVTRRGEGRKRWTERVRGRARFTGERLRGRLSLRINFFFIETPDYDLDNAIKPIQDALVGHVYGDDLAVYELRARKIDRSRSGVGGPSGEFVRITVARV